MPSVLSSPEFSIALIAAAIAAVVAFAVAKWQASKDGRSLLDLGIERMNERSFEHPWLEDTRYTRAWNASLMDDADETVRHNALRYDVYCILAFNLLERIFKFTKGNPRKIREILYDEEVIDTHRSWWLDHQNGDRNSSGYDSRFVKYVDSIVAASQRKNP